MKNFFFNFLCLIMAITLNCSCSDNKKMNALLENVPANTDFVLVGNLRTIVESAGGKLEDSKIKLPAYLISSLPNDFSDNWKEINSFLKESGIDTDACAIIVDYKGGHPVLVFSLNDKNRFVEAIENKKFKEEDSWGDVTFYSKKVYEGSDPEWDDYGYIAINGTCAYWIDRIWVGSKFKAIPFLETIIEEAQERSFAETPYAEFITDGNIGGISASIPKELRNELRSKGMSPEIASFLSGTICMRGELTNNQCSVKLKLFDGEGTEFSAEKLSSLWNTTATINEKALAFLGKDEFIISAVNLKDYNWNSYADLLAGTFGLSQSEKNDLNTLLSCFAMIDGTVACGFGLSNGLESIYNLYSRQKSINEQFSTTFVMEIEDGKTGQLIESMKFLMEKAQIPFDETISGLSIDLKQIGLSGNLYVKSIDNFIIIANHFIKENSDNELIKESNLSDNLFAFYIGLNKNNKLMRDLDLKNHIKLGLYCPNTMEASLVLDVDGDSETGLIAKVAKMLIGIIEQSHDFMRHIKYNYNQYDEVDVDTCAVWEEYVIDSIAPEEDVLEYTDSLAY